MTNTIGILVVTCGVFLVFDDGKFSYPIGCGLILLGFFYFAALFWLRQGRRSDKPKRHPSHD